MKFNFFRAKNVKLFPVLVGNTFINYIYIRTIVGGKFYSLVNSIEQKYSYSQITCCIFSMDNSPVDVVYLTERTLWSFFSEVEAFQGIQYICANGMGRKEVFLR